MKTRTTWGKGERAPHAKLDAEQVRSILLELSKGFPQRLIAEAHGVTRSAISDINRGATWTHVTGRRPNVAKQRKDREKVKP